MVLIDLLQLVTQVMFIACDGGRENSQRARNVLCSHDTYKDIIHLLRIVDLYHGVTLSRALSRLARVKERVLRLVDHRGKREGLLGRVRAPR